MAKSVEFERIDPVLRVNQHTREWRGKPVAAIDTHAVGKCEGRKNLAARAHYHISVSAAINIVTRSRTVIERIQSRGLLKEAVEKRHSVASSLPGLIRRAFHLLSERFNVLWVHGNVANGKSDGLSPRVSITNSYRGDRAPTMAILWTAPNQRAINSWTIRSAVHGVVSSAVHGFNLDDCSMIHCIQSL